MVATIVPLVQVAGRTATLANLVFVGGSAVGGAIIGLAFGALGTVLGYFLPVTGAWHVLGALAALAAAVDFGVFGFHPPELRGSVPRDWWVGLGPLRGALTYGLVLGMGVTTFIPVTGYYVLLAGDVLVGPEWGLALGAVYGTARALSVPIASIAVRIGFVDPRAVGGWPAGQRWHLRVASGVSLLVVAAGLLRG